MDFLHLVTALAVGALAPGGDTNFTRGDETARRFGVHEVVLHGDGSVAYPFDTPATVTFTAPSGQEHTVHAFYDGEDTWRARVYANETGRWGWQSQSADSGLDGKSGEFTAVASPLRGMLRRHPQDPKQWATDDGRWFLNVGDTAYCLFGARSVSGEAVSEESFRRFVAEDAALGVTSLRASALGALRDPEWRSYWADEARTRLNLESFQRNDARLRWMLDNHPDLYVQFILFPEPNNGYRNDESRWHDLPVGARERLLRNLVARFAAYPQLFYLMMNDAQHGDAFPNNAALVNDVGRYFREHDPWGHLISTGRVRRQPFAFPDAPWASYFHLEHIDQLGADAIAQYAGAPVHVFLGEDRYEAYIEPENPRYYFRRLIWSWLLAGGSAAYGGRWGAVHPYSQTGSLPYADPGTKKRYDNQQLVGLDSVPFIGRFFAERGISLAGFTPDDPLASDPAGRHGPARSKLARRGQEEFLVYHPNAKADGQAAAPAEGTAHLRLDLSAASGTFRAEWYRVEDGVAEDGGTLAGGAVRELTAPWAGQDAVLWVRR